MDYFAEYMVQKQPDASDRLKQGLIFAAAVLLSLAVGAVAILTGWIILFVLILGIGYGTYYLISSRNTEYEYSVTNGELDVDKILGKRKRVHLLTVPVSSLTAFGAYTDDTPDLPDVTLFLCWDNTGIDAYYADMQTESYGTARLLFTPDEALLAAMVPFLPAALKRQFRQS